MNSDPTARADMVAGAIACVAGLTVLATLASWGVRSGLGIGRGWTVAAYLAGEGDKDADWLWQNGKPIAADHFLSGLIVGGIAVVVLLFWYGKGERQV